MKILITDGLAPEGLTRLRAHADVAVHQGLTPEDLRAAIADADAVVVRSRTRVDGELLAHARSLRVIARAGVGVDNIDVDAATRRGILVLNTPDSSTISTAEHTMAMMLALVRHLPTAHLSTSRGEWQRENFTGVELYGKTLGVVGLGKIGSEVAHRAAAFGMRVIAYDPFVSAERGARFSAELTSWEVVLAQSDVLTVHVPLTPRTHHLLGGPQFAQLKSGAFIINCARGELVDQEALLAALDEGRVGGAALDVFESEPPREMRLLQHPHVIVTPHLAASTAEAAHNISVEIAEQVLRALAGQPAQGAVNLPVLQEEVWQRLRPFADLAHTLGAVAQQLVDSPIQAVECAYEGEVASADTSLLTASLLVGLLEMVLDQPINVVNAAVLARERGIEVSARSRDHSEDFSSLMTARLHTAAGSLVVGGTLFGRREPRITHLDGYRIDLVPAPHMLFVWNVDRPGMIGRVGSLLGARAVNIAGMQVGRVAVGGTAVMVLTVDSPVPDAVVQEIAHLDGISALKAVHVAPSGVR
jgi:D-3-phosphoglycerate dehydrogenase / 2-oxoglutarate reductase